jgi:hypothetical protein
MVRYSSLIPWQGPKKLIERSPRKGAVQVFCDRPLDLEDRFNFQRGLGRLASCDAEIYELLLEIRHVLKPLTLLDDHFIVRSKRRNRGRGQGKESLEAPSPKNLRIS